MTTKNSFRPMGTQTGWLGACALALAITASPAMANKAGAKATFVKGTVEVAKAEAGPFAKLKRNKTVNTGEFVRTGDASRVELSFSDGSILRVGPGSLLHMKEAGYNAKEKAIHVDATVVGGKAWAKVSKLVGSEAKFEVKSRNAVAGVRGTIFRVNVDRDQATVVKVYDGAVAVSNSPLFSDKPKANGMAAGPISADRKPVASPFQEVSQDEWEKIVERMMQVTVDAEGKLSSSGAFTAESDKLEDPEWVNWNLACDKGNCDAY